MPILEKVTSENISHEYMAELFNHFIKQHSIKYKYVAFDQSGLMIFFTEKPVIRSNYWAVRRSGKHYVAYPTEISEILNKIVPDNHTIRYEMVDLIDFKKRLFTKAQFNIHNASTFNGIEDILNAKKLEYISELKLVEEELTKLSDAKTKLIFRKNHISSNLNKTEKALKALK